MRFLNYVWLFTFFFVLSFKANAQTKQYDLNKDGKIDRVEFYKNSKLTRLEEDRNGDGKFDYIEIYDHPVFYLIIEQDTNFDGKIDFKKSYSTFKKNHSKILIAMDRNFDGEFEVSFAEIVNDNQKEADCSHAFVADEVERLINGGMSIAEQIPNGFIATGIGLKIDNECLKKWGSSFKETVKESVNEGMQCLDKLAKDSTGPQLSGAQRNAFGLNQLFKDDKVSLVCSDKEYDWSSTSAYASTSSDQKIKGKDISHPYLVLNPNYPEKGMEKRAEETKEIKSTIFHEMLHNLGYRHAESIEFSYGCETCCFGEGESKEAKATACKICTGNYTNEFDSNYLKDFVAFGKENSKEDFALATVLRFSKTQAKNLDSATLMAEASGGVFNPVGPELAKLILSGHSAQLKPEELDRLTSAKTYEDMEEFKISKRTNEVLAKSFYELYFNHNAAKTVAILKQNKDMIKREIATLEKKGENHKWIAEELQKSIDKVIFEMWVNEFPNKNSSNEAYDLHKFFEKK